MFNYYRICVDGIDKTGKDTIAKYVDQLSNHKYIITARGVMSMMTYADIYNRDYEYNLMHEGNTVNILLTVDYDDWLVRCKMTKEKDVVPTDYELHSRTFMKMKDIVVNNGHIVYQYNTSVMTPYDIAKDIINKMEVLNA